MHGWPPHLLRHFKYSYIVDTGKRSERSEQAGVWLKTEVYLKNSGPQKLLSK